MTENLHVESLGDHEYLVRDEADGETSESLFVASPSVLDQLEIEVGEERRVIERTAAFLTARQSLADLPHTVTLEDVTAGAGWRVHHDLTPLGLEHRAQQDGEDNA